MTQTATEKRFPLELLTRPAQERLAYFKSYTVAHVRLKQVHEALLAAIHEPAGASLIFVFGPGAVGKSTLRQIIEKCLIEEALPALEQDRGRLPVISFEVPPPDKQRFDWGDCYAEELQAGGEPLIDDKVDLDRHYDQLRSAGQSSRGRNGRVQDLRRALIRMLKHRLPAAVLVDEAQHLGRIRGANRLLDQLDCLKSLANQSGVVHVLLGSYELLAMRNLSAQLSWRSFDIHFSRYHANDAEDVRAFKGVLKAFQQQMPLEEEPDLVRHWKLLLAGSIGCVGVLKQWLTRALSVALEAGEKTVTLDHLMAQAPSLAKVQQMEAEATAGEQQLGDPREVETYLKKALGFTARSPGTEGDGGKTQKQDTSPPPPKVQGDVGQRKPGRDAIGGNSHGE